MAAFLLSLLPLAAVEITSFARLGILAVFLGSKNRPIARGAAFAAGTFVCYMILGFLFAVGLGQVLQNGVGAFADRLINPENVDYVISLVIGVLLLIVAARLIGGKKADAPKPEADQSGDESKGGLVTPFLTGFWSNAIVGPNTICSFAAFTQILKTEASVSITLAVLAFYNLLVVSPLLFFVWLSAVNRERADRFFESMRKRTGSSGKKLIQGLCLLIGLVMIADSIGFFLGHPLLPTGSKTE